MRLFLRSIARAIGFRPQRLGTAISGWRKYRKDRSVFLGMGGHEGFEWGGELPILTEWREESGTAGSYFLQDLTVARWLLADQPARHIDVGSRIDGFIGSVAAFRGVEVIDLRPQRARIPGVVFHQLDLTKELPREWRECTDSLSCLHSIEHFGLGRYGDGLDPAGHLKGLEQLKRLVKPGGRMYLSTPIGPQRIEFNAHRIFSAATLVGWFSEDWKLERFAIIDDSNTLHEEADPGSPELESSYGCLAGVGIVCARKSA